jgi:hypothetical protein
MSDETTAGDADDGAGLSLHDELAAALAAEPPEPDAAEPGSALSVAPQGDSSPARGGASENPPLRSGGGGPAKPVEGASVAPPPAWSAAAKAEFAALPEAVRKEVLKREADLERGQAQWDRKAARLDRLDAVLGPRSERLRLSGMDEAQALQALFAAQDLLERDPMSGLGYLARHYGVDLRSLGPARAAAQGQPPAEITRLAEEVLALKGAFLEQRSSTETRQRDASLGQVEAFAADPSKIYFENVREAMSALMRAGRAQDLEDAYQQAVWSDPEIRALLLREQSEAAQAAAREAAGARAVQARRAAGSVIGSPAPGATPGRPSPTATLRDELEAAFRDHAA